LTGHMRTSLFDLGLQLPKGDWHFDEG
jgi:hypothetical protein